MDSSNLPVQSEQGTAIPAGVSDELVTAHSDEMWRYDHAWRILNLNQELIRATDQRTYMLIVLSTLLISFTASTSDRIAHGGWARDATIPLLALSAIAFFVFALGTLLARQHPVAPSARRGSLVFFAQSERHETRESYCQAFHGTDRRDAIDDILAQIVVVTDILRKKLENYHRSWWCLGFQVAIFLILNIVGRVG